MPPLQDIIDHIQRSLSNPSSMVVVFDLDSTLFSTQPRNFAILNEFAACTPLSQTIVKLIRMLRVGDMGWNVMEDLRHLGVTDDDVLESLRWFWRPRFFHGDYVAYDEPLPGAVSYVQKVHGAGATVVYLTGRDEPNMGQGTRQSLRRHGFPFDHERVRLYLKPDFAIEDLRFKLTVIPQIKALGDVTAVFENEPAIANLYCDHFPTAKVFVLQTIHSPNPPPLSPRCRLIKDFVL